jgi:hypothetical protein
MAAGNHTLYLRSRMGQFTGNKVAVEALTFLTRRYNKLIGKG